MDDTSAPSAALPPQPITPEQLMSMALAMAEKDLASTVEASRVDEEWEEHETDVLLSVQLALQSVRALRNSSPSWDELLYRWRQLKGLLTLCENSFSRQCRFGRLLAEATEGYEPVLRQIEHVLAPA
ncbi:MULTISPECIES: hypothetical protein [Delftia]|uniref:hypothetical protein n=1 Tax=Delftia TaxID=80865 RepID=UPI000F825E80|nr:MULTISPECIES: hypothetical protein [Delftia]WEL95666.1 hypothetical protein PW274_16465 [Delftia tsuruhatensis]WQM80214.1 hypothetical protein RNT40_15955 [Delftia tsuruhatensis]